MHDSCKHQTDKDFVITRNSSYPFVTGDTFREAADFILDESDCPLDPKAVYGIVFVKCDFEEKWFRDYHPHVTNKYVLITHTGDLTAPHSELSIRSLRSPLLLAWFACNLGMKHPKLHPIPHGHNVIGRPNGIPGQYASIWPDTEQRWNEKWSKITFQTDFLVANHFSIGSNPSVRGPIANCLNARGFPAGRRLPYRELMKEFARYTFVASPPGNGIDCVRTWESFESASPPILLRNLTISGIWDKLPVIEVDSYCDLTELFLKKEFYRIKYGIKHGLFDLKRIRAQYWLNEIYDFVKLGRL